MSFDLDPAGDFASIADNLKAVSVDGLDVENALRRAVTTEEVGSSGGKVLASDTVFHIDEAEHPTRPEIGMAITDADGDWVILSVAWQTFVKRWRCVCRQLKIAAAQTVTIQRATFTKGTTGAVEPTWSTLAENVSARIQLLESRVGVENQNRTVVQTAKVYFAETQSLEPGDRIIGSGKTLKVLDWEGFDEIDQFFSATCEVSVWPQA